MTFQEALDRLPKCSHAVTEGTSFGDPVVEVWFLYFQDADEVRDPKAESGPCLRLSSSPVVDGRVVDGGVSDWWRPSEVPHDIPSRPINAEWHESAIEGDEEFPFGDFANVVLRVLEGEERSEARWAEGWPEKWESVVPG